MAFLRPVEVKLVPMSLEGIAFRTKVLDTDELMNYTSLIATISQILVTISQILVVVFPHGCTQNYQAISLGFDSSSTKNIIDACTKLSVKRLIYTSSPSVVFDGIHGIHNGEESLPYKSRCLMGLVLNPESYI
ncbi:uncharacterized protein LOC128127827 [Lactuca sativa]|uniref:uncharacterized protein LOC128127827 n=1 Tax=Lactuca sativa TaxID=4236 RepID=UPI0022B01ED6|nr:uncharacterized protein LOC128127827 [Lactuca sativa]